MNNAAARRDEHQRLTVADEPDRGRYALLLDGEVVGVADYIVRDNVVTVPHVETTPAHRGKNFAARLMHGVLDDIRKKSLTIRPACPYAAAYMRRRPETHDLLAAS